MKISQINSARAYIIYMSDSANKPEVKSLIELLQDSHVNDFEYAHETGQF